MRNAKRNRLLLAALAVFGCILVLGACLAVAAYRWISDLPNRIVVSIDGEEMGRAIVAATEMALREGPKPQRLETIEALAAAGADAAAFEPVLRELAADPDPEISAAAQDAIGRIATAPQFQP
jgi:hypothetical protein